MEIIIREYKCEDIAQMTDIWNYVVEEGNYFPQIEPMSISEAEKFFVEQSHTGVAVNESDSEILGLYILHPNNIGRCAHIANASYAVAKDYRNAGIGRKLVKDSIAQAKNLGFRLIQFNAVLTNNFSAMHLYEKLGFKLIGQVPGGFKLPDGTFHDIALYYRVL